MTDKSYAPIESIDPGDDIAHQSPSQPAQVQGWQVVPVEPSEKMLDILYHNGPGLSDHLLMAIWAELLAAAPKPPVQEPVAWVEVIDRHEGPYNFHGLKLLGSGKHHLYAAPQPSDDVSKVSKMARILSDREASACCVDKDDHWKIYSQEFIDDVLAMLEGSKGK